MDGAPRTHSSPDPQQPPQSVEKEQATPFAQQWVRITKQERIELQWRANYWETQHEQLKAKNAQLKQELILRDAKIKARIFRTAYSAKRARSAVHCHRKRAIRPLHPNVLAAMSPADPGMGAPNE